MNACDNFDEGGFSCAVLTHQCMNFTFLQLKLHACQGGDATKGLDHILQFENVILLVHPIFSFLAWSSYF